MLEGVGVARVPRLLAAEALADHKAIQILPELTSAAPVLFVYPPNPHPIARVFLEFMAPRTPAGA